MGRTPRHEIVSADAEPRAILTASEQRLVAEALRRAEETRNVMEDALVGFGRWVLVSVFDDDASAALEGRSTNAVWVDLVRRAGGPTLRLNKKLLYVALHIAARDKRITDESWRNLEPGRKALLLPLGDEGLMRGAARHVTSLKLTQRATRKYVTSLLAERGEARAVRVTAPRVTAQVRQFRERVTDKAFERKAVAALKSADDADAKAAIRELEAVRAWATRVLRRLQPE
ncbi:MAG: hypothetical protein ACKO4Q_19705 [Planctomycetota bacterium]